MSFNMMTLGGMAAAVGLVVDDAVVMLEHIMRRMQEGARQGRRAACSRAAAEMGTPLFGSTAATIVVFLPLAFISGVTGGFFKALALTMVAALGAVAALCPLRHPARRGALAARQGCRGGRARRRLHGPAGARLRHARCDRAFARPALFACGARRRRWRCLAMPRGRTCRRASCPQMDEGGFILDYKAQSRRRARRHRPPAAPGRADHPSRRPKSRAIRGAPACSSAAG